MSALGGAVRLPREVARLTSVGTPRDQWLEARKSGLGGSDIAPVLGVSPYNTPFGVWLEKTGRVPGVPETEYMRWGTLLEDTVAHEWASLSGARVRRCGMVADPVRPWRRASVDRVVLGTGLRAAELLEVKTTSARMADGLDDEELADHYRHQVVWYLGITGLDVARVAVLVGGQSLRTLTVEFDPDLWDAMGTAADAFWRDHVLPDVAPPIDAVPIEVLNRWPANQGEPVDASSDLLQLLEQRDATKAELAFWTDADELLSKAVKAHMGGATELKEPGTGRLLATWREQSRTDIDRAAMKADGIYDQYTTSSTNRVLRFKKEKGEAA